MQTAKRAAQTTLFLLFLCIPGTIAAEDAAPLKAPFEVGSATIASDYDDLLRPQSRGWLGADGAVSIPLGKKKNLWLFGDTILGTMTPEGKRSGTIVRNTIGLQDLKADPPGRIEYYWDLADRIPGSFFMAEGFDQNFWYWPMTGAMVDGELYIFLFKIFSGDDPGGLSFSTAGMELVRIPNPLAPPHRWKKIRTEFNIGDNHQNFCSAVFVEKPYLYLFGFDDGPENKPQERRMVLARVKIQDLRKGKGREAFEFWVEGESGGRWGAKPDNLLALFTPGVTESSVQFNAERGQYLCVTHYPFQPGVYVVSAPELTGPWSQPVKVYEIPELARNEDYHAYAMKSHPELAESPDEMVITYVVNTSDFWGLFSDPDIYYPRFVRVKLRWTGE